MTMQTCSVFVYTENAYREVPFGANASSETICRELCKYLKIQPIVNLLFALRFKGTANFLPGSQKVQSTAKYEFRLRHQIPNLEEFLKMDKAAFNYFFHQTKHDLVRDSIHELEYPNHKDDVAGLAYISMYNEILERHVTIDQLSDNYKKFVPAKLISHHGFRLKGRLLSRLRHSDHMNRDSS